MNISKQIKSLQIRIMILKLLLKLKILRQKRTFPTKKTPKAIVVHYDSGGWNFARVNQYHKEKWNFLSSLGFFSGYNYFIEYSGKVIQARADNEEGAHTVDPKKPGWWNKNSIGICLQGDNTKMTDKQKVSLRRLLDKKRIIYSIPFSEIYAHREIKPTTCPGQLVYNWLSKYRNGTR